MKTFEETLQDADAVEVTFTEVERKVMMGAYVAPIQVDVHTVDADGNTDTVPFSTVHWTGKVRWIKKRKVRIWQAELRNGRVRGTKAEVMDAVIEDIEDSTSGKVKVQSLD